MSIINSYYYHNQGGRERYIEKKITSSFETCSFGLELSKLPYINDLLRK